MADIPGIIEGASEGKGLGLRFLRHIERNSLLLFMVPGDTDDIRKEYEILLNELATFNPEMLDKQRVLAYTSCLYFFGVWNGYPAVERLALGRTE